MPRYKQGTRVGAIMGSDPDKKVIKLLGYGIYDGEEIPITAVGPMAEMAREAKAVNPKITLDNGKTVWGCECWWGPEDAIKTHMDKAKEAGYTINTVDIDKIRKDFVEASEEA